ncbi:MAG TPA: HmuY family protein [Methylomirabilota bacterium]|nr:HmuY family protein [Methylomirabilota bacterium]
MRRTYVAIAALVVLTVTLVALTLRQPQVPTYAPTPPSVARDAGRALVGPVLYTVDASRPDAWRYFSFRLGGVVEGAGPKDWDLAFRRYVIIANGGPKFPGEGGIVDLGAVEFEGVHQVPASGYQGNESGEDPRNPAIAGWYRYGFFSHVLSPRPHVWAVRTADGRYAKIALVSYYCAGGEPGCVTFRYVYQGDGSTIVGRVAASARYRAGGGGGGGGGGAPVLCVGAGASVLGGGAGGAAAGPGGGGALWLAGEGGGAAPAGGGTGALAPGGGGGGAPGGGGGTFGGRLGGGGETTAAAQRKT